MTDASTSAEDLARVQENFDLRLPAHLLQKALDGDRSIADQFVPQSQELHFLDNELGDPIGDERWSPIPGVTHRYPDRVLLKVTYQCASYCRFCFRRYKVSESNNNLTDAQFEACWDYLRSHKEISEVILTGGDPLVLSDKRLSKIFDSLNSIDHVKMIRIHTRIPTVLPSRINVALAHLLEKSSEAGKALWLVAHVNSASELSQETDRAFRQLKNAGVNLLSQTVLLRGINDSQEALSKLFRELLFRGVKPYYLHKTDLAQGTSHFRVPLKEAIELVGSLRGKISGLAIPQLVVDIPGGYGKVVVEKEWAKQDETGDWTFVSPVTGEQVKVADY